MSYEIKAPEKLEFGTDNDGAPYLLTEDLFLEGKQLTAIELEKLESKKQDREERKKYASHIFRFIWIWCAGIFVLMILVGLGVFKFDDSVIITLITTTTANILALFAIVAKYLFFRNSKQVSQSQVKLKKKKNKVT